MATMQNLGLVEVLPPQLSTTTVTGDAVDLQGKVLNRQIKAILCQLWTAAGDTDETLDVAIQESDTTVASDFAALATAANFTQVVADTASAVHEEIHFHTQKRYIRAVATLGGTSPSFTFGVSAIVEKRQQ